ncbi:MAG: hypothetical protein F7B59_01790 [Desulfurococcales archaeon]|nr:hypothetical protein [Desulfurococcales archaeon]
MSRFYSTFKETGIPRSMPSIAFLTDSKEAFEQISSLESKSILDSFNGEYGITGIIVRIGENAEAALIYYPSIPSLSLSLLSDLTTAGVRIAFKLGTAYSITKELSPGNIVIARAAVREDFISDNIVDPKLPAIPDFDLYFKVKRSLMSRLLQPGEEKRGNKAVGCIALSLGYIGKHINIKGGRISSLIKAPRLCAIDKDTSIFYTYGYLRSLRSISILVVRESFSSYSTFDLEDMEEQEEIKKRVSESIVNIYTALKDSMDYIVGSEIVEK